VPAAAEQSQHDYARLILPTAEPSWETKDRKYNNRQGAEPVVGHQESSIGDRDRDKVCIGGRGYGCLWRYPAIDGQSLCRTVTGPGDRIGSNHIAPVRRAARVAEHLIAYRCASIVHQTRDRGATRSRSLVKADHNMSKVAVTSMFAVSRPVVPKSSVLVVSTMQVAVIVI